MNNESIISFISFADVCEMHDTVITELMVKHSIS